MSADLSKKKKGSRRYKKLVRAKSRMKAKHDRVAHDMEHKVSRSIVDEALARGASTIVLGDIKDIADGVDLGKKTNQKISSWNHGQIRKFVEYKAQAEGIAVVLQDERYTSQTQTEGAQLPLPVLWVSVSPRCGWSSQHPFGVQVWGTRQNPGPNHYQASYPVQYTGYA